MRVPESSNPIRFSGSRVQPIVVSGDAIAAAGLVKLSGTLLKNARATEAIRAAQADLAYVNGKMSQTTTDFMEARAKLRKEHGNDSLDYVNAYAAFTRDYIDKVALDAPNLKTKNKLFIQLNTLQLSELKGVNAERDKAFKEVNTELFNQDIAATRTAIQNNWRDWEGLYTAAVGQYRTANETFMSDTEHLVGVTRFTSDVSKDVVKGWFREQTNKLSVLRDIRDGSLKAPEIQLMYNQLTFEQREVLATSMLDEYLTFIRAENTLATRNDDTGKDAFNQAVLSFYLADPRDNIKRQKIFDTIKLSNHMTPDRLIKLLAILAGHDSPDNPAVVFDVRRRIASGELTQFEQLIDVIGDGLSFDTARELIPVIEARNNVRFQNAKRILARSLGLPEGLIIFDPNEPKREEQAALEELERFFSQNPNGNFTAAAEGILIKHEAKIQAKRQSDIIRRKEQLKVLETEYLRSPNENLGEKIATIKRAIERLEAL